MFEKIVEKILSPILSEYVEDFNAENMKIGLWSGEVIIKNVRLRKEIIKKLNLPFRLKYSRLGCLKMSIPWKSLGSSKIDIVIDGLDLLITEVAQSEWECKNHKIIEKRKQEIYSFCDSIIQDFTKKSANAGKDEQEKGYFGGMVAKILDNIQVTIKDIHVRYEDELTKKYSFGVTLEELKIYTVNKKGEPQFVDRSKKQNENEPLRKKLILSNLGVYWNEQTEFYNDADPHSSMLLGIARSNQPVNPNINYLILMSSNAELLQRDAGKQYTQPQINIFIEFEDLKVKISNKQLQQIVTMSQRLQAYMNQVRFQNRKKLTQEEMIANHKIFMGLFPEYLQKKSNPADLKKIEDILEKMEVDNFKDSIKVYLQTKQKQKLVQQKMNKNKGWFSSKPKELTDDEMKQIESFVKNNFGTEVKNIKRPEDFYYLRVNFKLKQLSLSIANTQKIINAEEGINIVLSQILLDFNLREGGHMLNFQMGDIKGDIYKKSITEANAQSTKIILQKMRITEEQISTGQYVKLRVVGSPLEKKHLNTEIFLTTEELLVQFDPRLLKIAQDFAKIRINPQNTQAALEAYGQIKNKVSNAASSAAESIAKSEKKKNFLSLDVHVSSINLILFFNPSKLDGDIWAINFGQTTVQSDQQSLKKTDFAENEPMQKYLMTTKNMSMVHYQNKQAFLYSRKNKILPTAKEVVLQDLKADFEIQMYQKASANIPNIKAIATVHNLDLILSNSTYPWIQKIGDCFALPTQVEVEAKEKIEKIKVNQKSEIMKQSKKIGILYEQSSKEMKKFIGVLSGGYIYFYKDKKDIEFSTYYYVRNSKLVIQKEIDIEKKQFSLVVENSVNKLILGFDKQSAAEEWLKAIKSLEIQNQFIIKEPATSSQKTEQEPQKMQVQAVNPNILNFEVVAAVEKISVNTLLYGDRKATILISSLIANARLHETKTLARISLSSIQISDNIYTYKYGELSNFLYSESIEGKQKLIEIDFEQLSEKNPNYNEVGSTVSIEVGNLVCNYKPETVQNLMKFLLPPKQQGSEPVKNDALQKKQSLESPTKHDDHHHFVPEQELKKRKLEKQASIKAQDEKYSIKLRLKIQQVAVALVNRKTRVMFAKVGLTGLKLGFGQSNKKMDIEGGISELYLNDYSKYPNTLITEQQKYEEFSKIVQSFNKKRDMITFDVKILEYNDDQGKKMLIKAGLFDLSASYVQQPVLRLITYLTDQLLPSLTPTTSTDSQKPREIIQDDSKPQLSTMDIEINLENILAVVQPRTGKDELLELLIKNISVRNKSYEAPYIKNPTNESQKVIVECYEVKISGISIIQMRDKTENRLTNDMSIGVSCEMVQNTLYYQRNFGDRYLAGMRISCRLTPFLMRINHDDYNFIMKCLFWNITYDDNADGYLFDPVIKKDKQNRETADTSEPMYCSVQMDRIILCITEREVPLTVLFLDGLDLSLTLANGGMNMIFQMKNLFGTHLSVSQKQNTSIEKGMFNLFGYRRELNTKQLLDIERLVQIYSAQRISESLKALNLNIKAQMNTPVILVQFKSNVDTIINVKIQDLKIALELKNLLILSKLAIMDPDIQPPKATLPSKVIKKQEKEKPANSGRTVINIEMKEFLGSLSDKTGKNYVVMEGQFIVKLKMEPTKNEDEVVAKFKNGEKDIEKQIVASHSIQIRGFSLYFCKIDNLSNKRYILLPIKLHLLYSQKYKCVEDVVYLQSNIDGQLDRIIIQCSIRDMLLLNKVIQDSLQTLSEGSTSKTDPQPQKKIMQEAETQQPNRKSEISSLQQDIAQVDKVAIEKASREVQKKIKDAIKANMNMEPIQIRIVNDCNNNFMPVMNFIIQQSSLMFSSDAIKTHLSDALTLKLDFFNPRSANWEPVIETFKISFDYLSLVTEFGPATKIIVSSTDIQEFKELKINASTQLVSTLLATLEIAKTENSKIGQSDNVNQVQVSPYIIQNLTNRTIKVERILNNEISVIELQPLFKGPIKLTDKAEELTFIYEESRYSVNLEKFGLVTVSGLEDIHLDFRMDKLSRVLSFVNYLTIKNATFTQIYCLRYNENKQLKEEKILMEPGDIVPIEKQWFVQFSFNMKSATPLKKAVDILTSETLVSQSLKFKLAISEKRVIMGHSVLMLRTPFVILNCLPKNMEIQFISNGKQVSSKQILAQNYHQVFANDELANLKFKILCEGFYWSQQFWADPSMFGRDCYLYFNDRQNGGTSIKYIFENDPRRAQYRLNIFCPAFIVSELDCDLNIYSNLQRDETNKSIEKYYKLGGQSEFWRVEGDGTEKRKIDKRTLIGTESGSKIRVCGRNCLVDFSEPISIKNIGISQTRVVIETEVHGKTVSLFTVLGVEVSLKKMALRADILSRQITLRYRWIFFNNSNFDLSVKQQGGDKFYYEIQKGEKKPFYFIVPELKDKPKGLIFRAAQGGESVPVLMNGLGSIYFQLATTDPSKYNYFKLNIQEVESYLFYEITSVQYVNLPYQVVVRSQKIEAFVPLFNKEIRKNSNPVMFINEIPHIPYNLQLYVRPLGASTHQEVLVEADNLNYHEKLRLFEEGVTESMIFAKVYVIFNDSKKYIVVDQMHQDPEEIPEYQMQTMNFKLEKISLSIIQNHSQVERPYESFYFYLSNLQFVQERTNKRTKYQAKLQFFQFDQEEPYKIPNPVVITPIKYKQFTSSDPKDKPKSIFNALVEIDNSFVKNIFFNRIIIDINDIVINIGSSFIKLIMQIYKEYTEAAKAEQEFQIPSQINTWQAVTPPPQGSKTFIKHITIGPFTLNISAQIRLNELDQESIVIFGTLINALGVVITNIEDAPIVLDGITLYDCTDTMQGINSKLVEHYKSSVLRQLYKIFGSLNIIGNPVSLFRNISTGFRDLKDKPAEGLVEGPLEFGMGLAEGTSSLIAHSVGGALNSVEKVTGTIATGLAALTFDKEFEQRRERQKMKKPKHVFEGLEKGGKAVFHGFKQGLTGLVLKPYENAQKEGALGFFKGVAQGITGVVVKPVTGVIDFASKTTEGLKNTALYLEDKPNENRIRYPRVLYTETGIVKEYDAVDGKLAAIMKREKYEKYNLAKDYFMDSFKTSDSIYLVVLSQALVLIQLNDDSIIWSVPLRQMKMNKTDLATFKIEGPPQSQQFWQKSVSDYVTLATKEDCDRFQKLVLDLKINTGKFWSNA